jgi:hypothetical protein
VREINANVALLSPRSGSKSTDAQAVKTGVDAAPTARCRRPRSSPQCRRPAKPSFGGKSPGEGAERGIETQESDSVSGKPLPPKAMANGGIVDDMDAGSSLLISGNDTPSPYISGSPQPSQAALEANNRRMNPEAYGAKAHVGINLATAGLTDSTIAEMTAQGAFGRRRRTSSPLTIRDVAALSAVQGTNIAGFADGGQIVGPGTGTSDSIPAVNTDTGQPLAVSNGEVKVSPAVVQALGKDFFDSLIAKYHTPVPGQAPIYQAKGPMDTPLGMQSGTIIIPADVVEALGPDFFEQLERQYGGAQ